MRIKLIMMIFLVVIILISYLIYSPQSLATSENPLDARRKIIQEREVVMSNEGQARKERSIKILLRENVPINTNLPLIEADNELTRRTTEQVAIRALALCVVALKGEGLEQEIVDKVIDKYKISSNLTTKELEFIKNPSPTQHDRTQYAWRYECYWVMLWALGFIDKLERPDKICDVALAVTIMQKNGRDGFMKKAKLRSQSEILDAADLIYRYHWAIVDARIKGLEPPADLDGGIVMERHHALNWLIRYMNQEWDDVTTDT